MTAGLNNFLQIWEQGRPVARNLCSPVWQKSWRQVTRWHRIISAA